MVEGPGNWEKKPLSLQYSKRARKWSQETRSISFTSAPEKVMEQFILGVINKQVDKEESYQELSGWIHQEEILLSQLVVFCGVMTRWINEGRAVVVVYLDFSKTLTPSPIRTSEVCL